MKRFAITLILLTAALSLSGLSGYILNTKGTVKIQRNNSTFQGTPGTFVEEGDTVFTGSASSCSIILDNNQTLELDSGSQLTITSDTSSTPAVTKLFQGIWNIIKEKFTGTEHSNAALGTVGAVRGPADPDLGNISLTDQETAELNEKLAMISVEPENNYPNPAILEDPAVLLLTAAIFEQYYQVQSAELLYKAAISLWPEQDIFYRLLIDLYMNESEYAAAKEIEKMLNRR